MTNGIQIWRSTKTSKLNLFQSFQSISLSILAPWYVSNRTIHNDLNIPNLQTLTFIHYKHYEKFHTNIRNHTNPLIANFSITRPDNSPHPLKRNWSRKVIKKNSLK